MKTRAGRLSHEYTMQKILTSPPDVLAGMIELALLAAPRGFQQEVRTAAQNINARSVEAGREVRALPDGGKAALADSDAYVEAIKALQQTRQQRERSHGRVR